MVTARQYEGIGRFTIAFNEIDEVVKAYLPLIERHSRCARTSSRNRLQTFEQRATALRDTLEAASAAHGVVGAFASGIQETLDTATAISKKRNEYVHAVVSFDFTTNTRILQMRSGKVPPDENQAFDLASQAAFVASKLAESCEAILRAYLGISQASSEFAVLEEEHEGETME